MNQQIAREQAIQFLEWQKSCNDTETQIVHLMKFFEYFHAAGYRSGYNNGETVESWFPRSASYQNG